MDADYNFPNLFGGFPAALCRDGGEDAFFAIRIMQVPTRWLRHTNAIVAAR